MVVLGFFVTESTVEVDRRLAGGRVIMLHVLKSPLGLRDGNDIFVFDDTENTEYEDNE